MDQRAAIDMLKNGDIGGLEALVESYQARALRVAYLITGDAALAQDVVQEAFIHVYRAIHGFKPDRPFEPWFLRIVVNASIKAMNKVRRLVGLPDAADGQPFAELCAQIESVESQVETEELRQRIWEAMQALPPRQRAVIVQRYYLDMSEKDMATAGGSAPGTIKWLLNAARTRLRALLTERSRE